MLGLRLLTQAWHVTSVQLAVPVLSLIVLSTVPALAKDIYVSPQGSDSNNGTSSATPWQSIDKVNATLFAPGDQIFFQGGQTFTGGLTFTTAGTAANPIRISSYGTGRATISVPATRDGFFAYNFAGFSISNLNFEGPGATLTSKQGIIFYADLAGDVKLPFIRIDQVNVSGFKNGILIGSWNGATGYDDVRITNTTAHDNLEAGIFVYGYPLSPSAPVYAHRNVYVGYSRAYNNFGDPNAGNPSGSGILFSSVRNGIIERSVAYDNGKNNLNSEGPVGIWAYDSTSVTIQNNESYHNDTGGTGDGNGFDLDDNVTNSVLQYNYAHDNQGAGFLVYADATSPNSSNVVRYNISENDGKRLGQFGGIVIGGMVDNSDVYGNTVYVSSAASDPAALRIMTSGSTPTNVRVRNNIFYSSRGATGTVKLLDSPAIGTYSFQGNNYYDATGTFSIRWGANLFTSLNGWLNTATTQERQNGVIVGKSLDPRLGLPGGGGTLDDATKLESALAAYKLQAGSPMINAGVNLASFGIDPGTRDFYGDAIPANGAFDIGAHEVGTTVAPQPPATPQGLAAAATGTNTISVSWQDVVGETSYTLERAGTAGIFAAIAAPVMNATSYLDASGLTASTTYFYRIKALNAAGASAYSAVTTATTFSPPSQPPAAPASFHLTGTTRSTVSLAWSDVATETGYKIERSGDGTRWSQFAILGQNVTSFTVTGLRANTTYYFRLRAYNGGGNSAYAGPVTAKTLR